MMTQPFGTRRSVRIGATGFALVAVAMFVAVACAVPSFAQGSTGGTLGKTDQSLSGEAKPGAADKPSRAPDREPKTKGAAFDAQKTGCARIAGNWTWSNGLTVVVSASGTATATDGGRAVLACGGGTYLFKWQLMGNESRMTLSADGKRLSGSGVIGPKSAVRQ